MSETKRYSDAELEEFRQLILKKLEKAENEYRMLVGSVNNDSGNGVDDTSPTFKALEEGANTYGKETNARLAQRQADYMAKLRQALVRIDNKTYGICRVTGELIPKGRLMAVPHATLSVEAKNR